MMLPDPKRIASISDRLRNEARKRGQNYNELLYQYAFRGFLDRLSRSEYQQSFVLKGGQVLIAWGAYLRRSTLDIDFRGYTTNSVASLVGIVKDVCQQSSEPPDGLVFPPDLIEGEEISEGADYKGVRVRFWANLGNTRIRMQLDVGFSDEIIPSAVMLSYPALLGLPEPRILGYPLESIVAEKLQAIIRLGEINSRMKDFYDIWILGRQFDFDAETLQKAIQATFHQRNTQLPQAIPVGLSDDFAVQKQAMWHTGFWARIAKPGEESIELQKVISQLREFILPVIEATYRGESFSKKWTAGGPWR